MRLLESAGGFVLTVANARHIKAVPRHMTDMNDAEWLARLLRYRGFLGTCGTHARARVAEIAELDTGPTLEWPVLPQTCRSATRIGIEPAG